MVLSIVCPSNLALEVLNGPSLEKVGLFGLAGRADPGSPKNRAGSDGSGGGEVFLPRFGGLVPLWPG